MRRKLPPRAITCLAVLAAYAVVALVAEIRYERFRRADVPASYNEVSLSERNLPPLSCGHLLGTDNLGRDVASRLAQGTRIAFHVGIVTSCVAIPLGTILGLLAGYFGRRLDALFCALAAVVASVPSVLLVMAVAVIVGKGLLGIYLGISLTTWVGVFRTIRAETMKHRSLAYVQAARTLGYSHTRVLFRHIFPNVAHLVIIAFSTRFPSAVGTEVFLSFLGIGVQTEPSWGLMINNARVRLWQGQWWECLSVTLAVFGLVLCFNLLGDDLRDTLDPTLHSAV